MSNTRKEKEQTHTPTPWFIDALRESRGVAPKFTVCTLSGEEHTIAPTIDATDAAYIVKCVNAHEELVEVAKDFKAHLSENYDEDNVALMQWVDKVLAKAEKGE